MTRCTCDRCVRWPDSEAHRTARRWLAFELVRPLDVVLAHGPCSATEADMLAEVVAA
jgi:hypothetical protein